MITSLLKSFQWLLLAFGIKVKTLNQACKAPRGLPNCISAAFLLHLFTRCARPTRLRDPCTRSSQSPHEHEDSGFPPCLSQMTSGISVLCIFTKHQSLALCTCRNSRGTQPVVIKESARSEPMSQSLPAFLEACPCSLLPFLGWELGASKLPPPFTAQTIPGP